MAVFRDRKTALPEEERFSKVRSAFANASGKIDKERGRWRKTVRSVRFLGGGRNFIRIGVAKSVSGVGELDNGGAVDAAAGSFALDQRLSFSEIALDEIGGDLGDVGGCHVAVAAAVVVGPDRPEGCVDDELDGEVEGVRVLRQGIDEGQAAEMVFKGLFALALSVAGSFVAAVAMEDEMLVVMEEANERVCDDLVGAHPGREAMDDDFLVLMAGEVAVGGEMRVDVVGVGQNGLEPEPLKGGSVVMDSWGVGHCNSPLQNGMCERGWISEFDVLLFYDFVNLSPKTDPVFLL